MRFGYLLICVTLAACGSENGAEPVLDDGFLPKCVSLPQADRAGIENRAKDYFLSTVGAKVIEVRSVKSNACGKYIVVAIEARVGSYTNLNHWIVRIEKADKGKMVLMRPE